MSGPDLFDAAEARVADELERCGFGPNERYQLYTVDAAGERRLLATAADMEAIGTAIRCMGEEGELDGASVGILDRYEHSWIVNPWAAGRIASFPRPAATARRSIRNGGARSRSRKSR